MTPEEALGRVLGRCRDGRVAVAVSGGGDSTALLHACALLAPGRVVAATVDHGLRAGSAAEAQAVARACAALGVPHATLAWDGGGRGNLQARAREARLRLIGGWAGGVGAAVVLLGHTADDQAETVLLRLARGSGVDGLAGMPARFEAEGLPWERPFLALGREALREWLRLRAITWAEDPSNEDPRFDRARARAMMGALVDLGLTRERLLLAAGHMARARASLDARAADLAREGLREEGADLLLDRGLLGRIDEEEAAGRLVASGLMRVGGTTQRPRWASLRRLASIVLAGRAATLAGCRVAPEGRWVRIAPEARHAQAPRPPSAGAGAAGMGPPRAP